jgi:hypothetical protein
VYGAALSPDGRFLVCSGQDGAISFADLAGDAGVQTLAAKVQLTSDLVLTVDGRAVALERDALKVFSLQRNAQVLVIEGCRPAAAGLHLVDGDRRAIFGAREGLTEVDLTTGSVVCVAPGDPGAHPGGRLAVAHGGAFAAVVGDGLTLWDLRAPRRIARLVSSALVPDHRGPFWQVRCAISADGRAIVTGDREGRIRFARWTDP